MSQKFRQLMKDERYRELRRNWRKLGMTKSIAKRELLKRIQADRVAAVLRGDDEREKEAGYSIRHFV